MILLIPSKSRSFHICQGPRSKARSPSGQAAKLRTNCNSNALFARSLCTKFPRKSTTSTALLYRSLEWTSGHDMWTWASWALQTGEWKKTGIACWSLCLACEKEWSVVGRIVHRTLQEIHTSNRKRSGTDRNSRVNSNVGMVKVGQTNDDAAASANSAVAKNVGLLRNFGIKKIFSRIYWVSAVVYVILTNQADISSGKNQKNNETGGSVVTTSEGTRRPDLDSRPTGSLRMKFVGYYCATLFFKTSKLSEGFVKLYLNKS